ncbi:MaoC/PaaZ C-terminal domain-containing protein, partial [Actinophytocola sp.]|uniref:MaoC/PaaZ C-terminal domain-containing protein n=1 Tax=Actinophytocola sp. TaxID=1872138 RepID=UPI00389ABDE3
MRTFSTPGELVGSVGTRLGTSSYQVVLQHDVDVFAALTGDRQWIHVDPRRAAGGPFGGPIAHGMYLLSLVLPMLTEVYTVDGAALVLNKGFDRVRFLSPVPVGARVRL